MERYLTCQHITQGRATQRTRVQRFRRCRIWQDRPLSARLWTFLEQLLDESRELPSGTLIGDKLLEQEAASSPLAEATDEL